jgi:Trypsin-like peptidase domain
MSVVCRTLVMMMVALASQAAWIARAEAQQIWRPPAAPDDVRLASEAMAQRGVVKIIGMWNDGSPESGAGIMLGHERGDLYLMTAAHVVNRPELGNANRIIVQFLQDSGRQYAAALFKNDDATDFAVVVLRGFYEARILDQLVKFPLDRGFAAGTTGQPVKAIGHPGDGEWLVTHGQTLASTQVGEISLSAGLAQPGNSGGALLDAGNRLVGMVTGGEGNTRDIGITVSAMLPFLERWNVPYRMRIVEPLEPVIEQIRAALWNHDWQSLTGESLKSESNDKVWRARLSLLASEKSIVLEWFKVYGYLELLGTYQSPPIVDEAWRVWLRAISAAIGPGYEVQESGPRQISFSQFKAFAWPTSRRVTFQLFESRGRIYFHAYEFDAAHGDSDSGRLTLSHRNQQFME